MPFLAAIPIGLAIAGGTVAAAGIGAAGSIAAGKTQANAAKSAEQLQYQQAQNSLDFQKQQWNTQQQQMAPWLQTGQASLSELGDLMGIPGAYGQPSQTATPYSGLPATTAAPNVGARPVAGPVSPNRPNSMMVPAQRNPGLSTGPVPAVNPQGGNTAPGAQAGLPSGVGGFGSLLQPFTDKFQAPTLEEAQKYPGYQFQLQQGQNAIENSAAARGGLVSGNTATALNNYSQGAAQSDYNNVYNEAMQNYLNNYNMFQQNQTNQYNRLASLSGLGQTTAQQLGAQGQAAAGNVSNINLTAGQQIGQNINNAGAATASGYAGATNAAMGGITNLAQLAYLNSLQNGTSPYAVGGNTGAAGV